MSEGRKRPLTIQGTFSFYTNLKLLFHAKWSPLLDRAKGLHKLPSEITKVTCQKMSIMVICDLYAWWITAYGALRWVQIFISKRLRKYLKVWKILSRIHDPQSTMFKYFTNWYGIRGLFVIGFSQTTTYRVYPKPIRAWHEQPALLPQIIVCRLLISWSYVRSKVLNQFPYHFRRSKHVFCCWVLSV